MQSNAGANTAAVLCNETLIGRNSVFNRGRHSTASRKAIIQFGKKLGMHSFNQLSHPNLLSNTVSLKSTIDMQRVSGESGKNNFITIKAVNHLRAEVLLSSIIFYRLASVFTDSRDKLV